MTGSGGPWSSLHICAQPSPRSRHVCPLTRSAPSPREALGSFPWRSAWALYLCSAEEFSFSLRQMTQGHIFDMFLVPADISSPSSCPELCVGNSPRSDCPPSLCQSSKLRVSETEAQDCRVSRLRRQIHLGHRLPGTGEWRLQPLSLRVILESVWNS